MTNFSQKQFYNMNETNQLILILSLFDTKYKQTLTVKYVSKLKFVSKLFSSR